MINEETKQAIMKLENEYTACKSKLDRYGKVIGGPVKDALINFCNQNSEFARAILRSTKNVGECIKSCVKGNPSALSDIDVYRAAVSFYFSGATVNFKMTIDLGDDGFSNDGITDTAVPKLLDLSLDDLFG